MNGIVGRPARRADDSQFNQSGLQQAKHSFNVCRTHVCLQKGISNGPAQAVGGRRAWHAAAALLVQVLTMTILAMLSGFILAVVVDKNSTRRVSQVLHEVLFNNPIALVSYAAFSTTIIGCAIVFHTGVSAGAWAWPYKIGAFLTKPIVGLTIVFFILGAWIGVERARLRRFLDRMFG
jgi:hypothetical protein